MLVTHDRYLMDRVSTLVLGLDGMGHAERFADVSQWEAWQQAQEATLTEAAPARKCTRGCQLLRKQGRSFPILKRANLRDSSSS